MVVKSNILRSRLLVLMLTMLLAACRGSPPGDDQMCKLATDFSNIVPISFPVPAESSGPNDWVASGVTVTAGEFIGIRVPQNEQIDLCANRLISNSRALNPTTNVAKVWQATNLTIPYGHDFKITVDEWWRRAGTLPVLRNGTGMYGRLAEPGIPTGAFPGGAIGADFGGDVNGDINGLHYGEPYVDQRVPGMSGPYPYDSDYYPNLASLTPFQSLTQPPTNADVAKFPNPKPGKRIFELNDGSPGGGFEFVASGATPDEISVAWHGFTTSQYALVGPTASPLEKELYVRFNDHVNFNDNRAGNTQNGNSEVIVTVEFSDKCPGIGGQHMLVSMGDPNGSGYIFSFDPYQASHASYFGDNVTASGQLYFRINDVCGSVVDGICQGIGDGDYSSASNTGVYNVTVTQDSSGFTEVINAMIDPVKDLLQGPYNTVTRERDGGLTKDVYENLAEDTDFINFVRALMILSVVFFGFNYMLGLTATSQREFVEYVIKMGIVSILISEDSWSFFYTYLFTFFIEGTESLIQSVSGQFIDAINAAGVSGADAMTIPTDPDGRTSTFSFINQTMQKYFSNDAAIRLEALMFSSLLGFIMAILIYVGIILFVIALLKAVILYILSIIMVSLMLFLAPLFITFLLFGYTRLMFNNWIKNLISYSIQPVLLFTVLTIFNVFIYSAFYSMVSFHVCWGCLLHIDFPVNEVIFRGVLYDFDAACLWEGYKPWSISSGMDPDAEFSKTPVAIFMVFIFIIFCSALLKFLDWIVEVGVAITAGGVGNSLNKATNNVVNQGTGIAKHAARAATSVGKAGFTTLDWGTERVFGERMSDRYIKTKRQALKMMGGRSVNPFINAKGGSDGMGGKSYWKQSLMTSREKRELATEQKLYDKLSKHDKKEKRIENMKKEIAYEAKKSSIKTKAKKELKNIKKELKQEKKKNSLKGDLLSGNSEFREKSKREGTRKERDLKLRRDELKATARSDRKKELRDLREEKQGKGMTRDEQKKTLRAADALRKGKDVSGIHKGSTTVWRDAAIDAKKADRNKKEFVNREKSVLNKSLRRAALKTNRGEAAVLRKEAYEKFQKNVSEYEKNNKTGKEIRRGGRDLARKTFVNDTFVEPARKVDRGARATYRTAKSGANAVYEGGRSAIRGGKAAAKEANKFRKAPVKYTRKTADKARKAVVKGVKSGVKSTKKAVVRAANVPIKAAKQVGKEVKRNNDRIVGNVKSVGRGVKAGYKGAKSAVKETRKFAKNPGEYTRKAAKSAGEGIKANARNSWNRSVARQTGVAVKTAAKETGKAVKTAVKETGKAVKASVDKKTEPVKRFVRMRKARKETAKAWKEATKNVKPVTKTYKQAEKEKKEKEDIKKAETSQYNPKGEEIDLSKPPKDEDK